MMEDESDEVEFEVEKIMDHRDVNGKLFYLVKWCGFPSSDNTWEPRDGLVNCQEAINEYHAAVGLGKKRKRPYKAVLGDVKGNGKFDLSTLSVV